MTNDSVPGKRQSERPLIVVADDDPAVRRLLEVTIKNAGCEVAIAKNGDEALELIQVLRPDLAILDVSMPYRTGWEVGRELRRLQQPVPIIYLTSHVQEADVLQGFDSGAVDYLFKPFSPKELQARLRSALSRL